MPLNHSSAYAEFLDEFDDGCPVDPLVVVRLVNGQMESISESLESQLRTDNQRRRSVVHLLEQCILICSEMIPCSEAISRRRFRRIRRAVERARRLAHFNRM